MKYFTKIKNMFILGKTYNYRHVFKVLLRKLCIFIHVHTLIKIGFRLRGVKLNTYSNRTLTIMNELRRRLFHQNGKKVLQDLDAIFQKHGIVYWVDWGTLLGIMRDKAFITHDMDIDISVLCDDSEHVSKLLEKHAYTITAYTLDSSECKTFFRAEKYKVPIDIGFFRVEENTGCLFCTESVPIPKHIHTKKDTQWATFQYRFISDIPGDVIRHVFDDVEINIPRTWKEHLEVLYGKDWSTPRGLEEHESKKTKSLFDKKNPHVRYVKDSYIALHSQSPSTITTKLLPWKLKLEVFYYYLTCT